MQAKTARSDEDGAVVAPAVERLPREGIDARGRCRPTRCSMPAARETYDALRSRCVTTRP